MRGGRSRTMPELAQVRNRVKELAAAPAQTAPAPAQPAAAPAAPPGEAKALPTPEHTPERSAKINRLVSALDADPSERRGRGQAHDGR